MAGRPRRGGSPPDPTTGRRGENPEKEAERREKTERTSTVAGERKVVTALTRGPAGKCHGTT
jgi:hypothetical protein